MKFHVLASGSKGNCTIISHKDTKIVIDCGTTQKYLNSCFNELKISPSDIQACLITHTHTDHISALKYFKNCLFYSEDVLEVARQVQITSQELFKIGAFKIATIRLSHDSRCLGYIIEADDEKLVYVTDTGYLKENYYELISDADYYIFESNHDLGMLMQCKRPEYVKNRIRSMNGHLCNEDSARHLRRCITDRTKQIILAHISQEANDPQLAYDICKSMISSTSYKIDVQAAKQFEIVSGGRWDD